MWLKALAGVLLVLKDLPDIIHDLRELLKLLKSVWKFIRASGDAKQTEEISKDLKSAFEEATTAPIEVKREMVKGINGALKGGH